MDKRLGKKQWIDFGLKTLAKQGINSVRIEPMAAQLKVTKGSFYWHFKNRNALLAGMLDAWQAYATSDVIANVEHHGGDASARLRSLFNTVLKADNRLDKEIRIWADSDKTVATALKQIDSRRTSYLEKLFLELGFSPTESIARARLVYHAFIGQFTMSTQTNTSSDQFEAVFNMLVQNPGENQ